MGMRSKKPCLCTVSGYRISDGLKMSIFLLKKRLFSYDYETLDGKRRLSDDQPSKIFIALHTFLFLFALNAISRSFGHHARKDAGTNLPVPIEKM